MASDTQAQEQLDRLGREGTGLLDGGDPTRAAARFEEGVALSRSLQSTASFAWFLAHLGFARVALGEWHAAIGCFNQAILAGQLGNPYVHLMRGIAVYESGDLAEAKTELFKAAVLAGPKVFRGSDRRYWEYAVKGMAPPVGCSEWQDWRGAEPQSELWRAMCDPSRYRLFVDRGD